MNRRFITILNIVILSLITVLLVGNLHAQDVSTTSSVMSYDFDPKNFENSTKVDNQWFPLQPGMQYTYEGITVEDDGTSVPHRVIITVTDLTKVIGDVRTVVTWDRDYSDGELVEAELAFFAQDKDGAVWRVGEYPEEYDAGKVIASPAWIHGFEDAKAGIMMLAQPKLDAPAYREGWGPVVNWTDFGRVDQMGQKACVPVNCYEDILVIAETSDSEADAYQLKYYAPQVGNVRVDWRGTGEKTQETLELSELVQLSPEALAEVRAAALLLEQSAYNTSKNVYANTSPLEYPPGTPVAAAAVTSSEMVAKGGHWEGKVNPDDNAIAFDITPMNEVDNIEVGFVIAGTACVAEVELTALNSDGTFILEAAAETNGIQGAFESATTATGKVTLHTCSGNPVPPTSNGNVYEWSAQWVSDQIGFKPSFSLG